MDNLLMLWMRLPTLPKIPRPRFNDGLMWAFVLVGCFLAVFYARTSMNARSRGANQPFCLPPESSPEFIARQHALRVHMASKSAPKTASLVGDLDRTPFCSLCIHHDDTVDYMIGNNPVVCYHNPKIVKRDSTSVTFSYNSTETKTLYRQLAVSLLSVCREINECQ